MEISFVKLFLCTSHLCCHCWNTTSFYITCGLPLSLTCSPLHNQHIFLKTRTYTLTPQYTSNPLGCRPTRCTRGHSLKISKHSCTKDIRKYCFSNKVINRWNSLPDHIVQASSINVFKNGLQKMRSTRMGFFIDNWCSLTLEVVFQLRTSVLDRRQVRPHLVSNLVSMTHENHESWFSDPPV